MNTEIIKLENLIENPNNTRIHTEKQIKEFVKSIEMFGVVRPIVVDENNMILIGHGLKKSLESMGRTEAEVLRMTGLTDNEKKKLLLSDNKIYSLGVDDFDMIDELIKGMQDFEIPGYDPENLEMLYGASSLVESEAEFKQNEEEIKERIEKQTEVKEIKPSEIPVPKAVQEARAEQKVEDSRKYVICPHCGGKVYVS